MLVPMQSVPVKKLSDKYHVIQCDNNVVTLDTISYLMILIAYPIALYTFRKAETEHLSSLAETVSLHVAWHKSSNNYARYC